jgi:hypothetical protein
MDHIKWIIKQNKAVDELVLSVILCDFSVILCDFCLILCDFSVISAEKAKDKEQSTQQVERNIFGEIVKQDRRSSSSTIAIPSHVPPHLAIPQSSGQSTSVSVVSSVQRAIRNSSGQSTSASINPPVHLEIHGSVNQSTSVAVEDLTDPSISKAIHPSSGESTSVAVSPSPSHLAIHQSSGQSTRAAVNPSVPPHLAILQSSGESTSVAVNPAPSAGIVSSVKHKPMPRPPPFWAAQVIDKQKVALSREAVLLALEKAEVWWKPLREHSGGA